MEQEVSYFSEGARISAVLYTPETWGNGTRLPAIVLCHGFTGIKELILPDYARRFAEAGFAALAFDYRGFGASEGERGRLLWPEQILDIRNSITFLETFAEVDPERIGLWGTSYGAANAVYAAGVDERARCTVAQAGFGDGGRRTRQRPPEEAAPMLQMLRNERRLRVLTGRHTMADPLTVLTDPETGAFFTEAKKRFASLSTPIPVEFLERTLEYRPESVAGMIAPRALLLIAAGDDTVTPAEESRSIYCAAGNPKRLVVLDGVRHYELYEGEPLERSAREAITWYQEHL